MPSNPRLHELKHYFNVAVGWNRFRAFRNSQKTLAKMWIEGKISTPLVFKKGEHFAVGGGAQVHASEGLYRPNMKSNGDGCLIVKAVRGRQSNQSPSFKIPC